MGFVVYDRTMPLVGGLVAGLVLALLAVFLRISYSLPVETTAVWYAAVFLCFYVPGNLLLRTVRWRSLAGLSGAIHATGLGVALAPVPYAFSRLISAPWIVYPFFALLFVVWLFIIMRETKGTIESAEAKREFVVFVIVLATVVVLLSMSSFSDLLFVKGGLLLRHANLNETIFHVGIIHALSVSYPPHFPYESGVPFGFYHLNMHLEIEMLNRLFGIDIVSLAYHYSPLLYAGLLVYVPYIFVRRYLGPRIVGVVAGLLVFGSDLSFIPGILLGLPPHLPWNGLLNPVIWPLLTLNGFSPALIALFLSVLHLKEYFEQDRIPNLILFAMLGFAAYGFKSSTGPHIMGAACLTAAFLLSRSGDRQRGARLLLVSLLSLAAIALDVLVVRGGAGTNVIAISVLDRFRDSLGIFGIVHPSLLFLVSTLPVYLALALGVKLAGISAAVRGFRPNSFDPIIVFLALFVVIGLVLSETIFLGPIVPAFMKTNNAMWFSFESLTAAIFLVSYALAGFRHDGKQFWAAVVLVLTLSMPGTVQFLYLRTTRGYDMMSPAALEIVAFLKRTPADAVVLHPINNSSPSLSANLAGRQTVLSMYQSYVIHYADMNESAVRLTDVKAYFNDISEVDRAAILKRYRVRYVVAPLAAEPILKKDVALTPVMKNQEFVVYETSGR